ncbi:glucan endo-1 3-beta-glucosidase 7 [Phtheirospermum japonicum]|uniref:Glucan endo-1 3-beta-glucosidase 7 n=1 Tax=Phtheirospermum japonicum TaxID=374723 RepID=A0A830B1A1_9LAMI|nr:glucan endo-1 3-beta-glucosidase 7 [Phtheirospermum japonicum]
MPLSTNCKDSWIIFVQSLIVNLLSQVVNVFFRTTLLIMHRMPLTWNIELRVTATLRSAI